MAYSTYQECETSGDLERFGANWVLGIVGGADLVGGEEIPPMNYHLTRQFNHPKHSFFSILNLEYCFLIE